MVLWVCVACEGVDTRVNGITRSHNLLVILSLACPRVANPREGLRQTAILRQTSLATAVSTCEISPTQAKARSCILPKLPAATHAWGPGRLVTRV